ncbi:MAG: serine/threonine protein kinase [Gemmatimonadaceae bacterium]|nr:serine/threonine protein kinase [Gemmatimonadaceae bacterium]
MAGNDLDRVRQRLGDRYAIERELGRGGMGTVYLARDLKLDRAVALKVLPAEFAADTSLRERFLRETRTSASFSHPNIVPVHAVEESDDLVAFAMGYVEGESVAERVRRAGPLGVRELVRLVQDVGYALAYAHGRGIVHRDLKPDNVMIERATGRALLMDFGISRVISATAVAKAGLTRVGEVVGTPEYMSPEQASADVIDGRSDLYSLGLVAYFAATATTAMEGESTQRILVRQLTEVVPSVGILRPDLPAALTAAVDRCCAKEANDRFPTAEALVEAIDQAQLAAPEIPIPVRLLAQELLTLSLVVVFIIAIGWLLIINAPEGMSTFDSMLPLVILFGVLLARVLQTLSEARRTAVVGFAPSETMRGMRATVDERAGMRAQLLLDPDVRKRRKRTIISALIQLVIAVVLIKVALLLRIEVRPKFYRMGVPGLMMVISGMVLVGLSLVLLIRSPFRMPIGERAFRLIWLGAPGRAFLRMAARGVSRSAASGSSQSIPVHAPVRRAEPAPAPSPKTTGPTLATLDTRLTELERWRAQQDT